MDKHQQRAIARFALYIAGQCLQARQQTETHGMYEGHKPNEYRPINDPDPRAFLLLQVELALKELDQEGKNWHTQIFHHVHVNNKPLRTFKNHPAARSLYGAILQTLGKQLRTTTNDITIVQTIIKEWDQNRRKEYNRLRQEQVRRVNSTP